MNQSNDPQVSLNKSQSPKITIETEFKKTEGRLQRYDEGCNSIGFDRYPRIDVVAGDDLNKFQHGIIRITIKEKPLDRAKHYFIKMDAIQSVIFKTYGTGKGL
jgi:hypothetical protein